MEAQTTLALALGCAAAAVFFGWRGAQPLDIKKGPRLIPWRPMMAASATATLVFLVHLMNLFGVNTGR